MDTKAARTWLLANGYHVKPKGRIPADLQAMYTAKVLKKRGNRSDSVCDDSDSSDSGDGDTSRKKKVKRTSCGFCTVRAEHRHRFCPGSIQQGSIGGLWVCLCSERGHVD